ncbi:radical SAM protein, partial [Candidatus Bathyarchaeota archaeon]|nr:radical SAM protein [Candidatus Bathyarchaeota archaeon]
DHVLGMLDELVEAYKNEKVFKFLHLPVQSGDDTVLKLMNRHYTVEDFREVVQAFREKFPKITVSTDVICGFPGEGMEAFERTKWLVAEVQPDIVNVSKFFARPRTPAAELEPVPPRELNRRSREVAELSKSISFDRNRAWIDWEGTVMFDEKGKSESVMGRNFAYKPVVAKAGETLLGKLVKVRVVDAFSTYLEAETV